MIIRAYAVQHVMYYIFYASSLALTLRSSSNGDYALSKRRMIMFHSAMQLNEYVFFLSGGNSH